VSGEHAADEPGGHPPDQAGSSPPSARSRLDEEDRALYRALGARVSEIIHGAEIDLPDLQRRDELGIFANMVNRLARELGAVRRRDREREAELQQRAEQLAAAYQTHDRLLGQLRETAAPILEVQRGVVLVPLNSALDDARLAATIPAALEQIAAARPRAIVLHVTHVDVGQPDGRPRAPVDGRAPEAGSIAPFYVTVSRQIERLARRLGARVILSGWPPESRRGLRPATPDADGAPLPHLPAFADLDEALAVAADHAAQRITR
jgi:rsbT co-antagonist protein RsbR